MNSKLTEAQLIHKLSQKSLIEPTDWPGATVKERGALREITFSDGSRALMSGSGAVLDKTVLAKNFLLEALKEPFWNWLQSHPIATWPLAYREALVAHKAHDPLGAELAEELLK